MELKDFVNQITQTKKETCCLIRDYLIILDLAHLVIDYSNSDYVLFVKTDPISLEAFSVDEEKWNLLSCQLNPFEPGHFSMIFMDNFLYIIRPIYHKRYSLINHKEEVLNPCIVPRYGACAIVQFSNRIYLFGGGMYYNPSDTGEYFDCLTGNWILIKNKMKMARNNCSGCVYKEKEKIIISGGDRDFHTLFDLVESYDIKTETFISIALYT
jgi:hypothetical protein